MDELQKLYDVLVREGKYTKSFEEFKNKWSSDTDYQNQVFDVVSRDGLYTKDKQSFFQKYSGAAPVFQEQQAIAQPQVKKKEPTMASKSGVTSSVSPKPADQNQELLGLKQLQKIASEPIVSKRDAIPSKPQIVTSTPSQALRAEEAIKPIAKTTTYESERQRPTSIIEVAPVKLEKPITVAEFHEQLKEKEAQYKLNRKPEDQYFTGEFGDILNSIPILGERIDDFGRAVNAGLNNGDIVMPTSMVMTNGKKASSEEINKYIEVTKKAQSFAPSDEMQDFSRIYQEGGSNVFSFLKGLATHPSIAPELVISSFTGLFNPASAAAAGTVVGGAAAYGALATPEFGGVGAVPAAAASIPYAMGAANTLIETSLTFSELLQDELKKRNLDFTEENVRKILEDDKTLNSIRNKSISRGMTIGAIDALTGRVAGKVGAKLIGNTPASRIKAGLAAGGIESGGGMFGEAAGRAVAGQEMDVAEIGLEGIAEGPTAVISIASELIQKPTYKVNGEITTEDNIKNIIDTATPEEISKIKIDIKNDKKGYGAQIQDKVLTYSIKEQVRSANPDLNEPSLNAITDLEKQLQKLEGNKTQTGKDKAAAIRTQIKDIQENQLQEEAVVETVVAEAKPTQEVVTTQVNVAPYFNTKIETIEDAEKLRSNEGYQKHKENLLTLAKDLGIKNAKVDDVIGGYYNDETKEDFIEISNVVTLEDATIDQAEIFAALAAVTSPEVQQATIAAQYTDKGSGTHNANEYTIKVSDVNGAMKSLKEAGISDFTVNERNGTISFIDIIEFEDAEFERRITKFVDSLENKGINYEESEYRPIESRYVDKGKRKEILTGIKSERTNARQGGENLYTKIDEAIARDAEFNGISIEEYLGIPKTKTVEQEVAELNSILQEKKPLKAQSQEIFDNVVKSVKTAFPDLFIQSFDTVAEMKDFAQREYGNTVSEVILGGEGGIIIYNRRNQPIAILTNLEGGDVTTMPHEAWHAILVRAFGDNQKLFTEFRDSVNNILRENGYGQIADDLETFANNKEYIESNTQAEEWLVQLGGMLTASGIKSDSLNKKSKTLLTKLKDLINQFAERILGEPVFLANATPEDVLDFMVAISDRMSRGESIADFFEKQEFKKPTNEFKKPTNEFGKINKQIISANANLSAVVRKYLEKAQAMEKDGTSETDIKIATGWERGADNKWRYEIPDGEIKDIDLEDLKDNYYDATSRKNLPSAKLSDIYVAPDLYQAYPEAANILVVFKDLQPSNYGSFNPYFKRITINKEKFINDKQKMQLTLIHEIQHYVQEMDGLEQGSSSGIIKGEVKKRLDNLRGSIKALKINYDAAKKLNPDDKKFLKETKDLIDRATNAYKEFKKTTEFESGKIIYDKGRISEYEKVYDLYIRTAGEVEARNAALRSQIPYKDRRFDLIKNTQEVASEDQIFFKDKEEVQNLKAKLQRNTDLTEKDIIKVGLANGFSDEAIRTVLQSRGFTEEQINAAFGTTKEAAKKVEVTPEFAKGYKELKAKLEKEFNSYIKLIDDKDKGLKFIMTQLKKSDVYRNATDVQKEKMVRDIRAIAGKKEKPAPSVNKLFGNIKDVTKITMTEKQAFAQQMKSENRGGKDAKKLWMQKSAQLTKDIKELADSGKITAKQAAAVLRKFSGVNLFDDASIDRFIEYMSKVFEKAEYAESISKAFAKLPTAKRNAKTKLGIAESLMPSLNRLLSIKPTLIPDAVLDSYLDIIDMIGAKAEVLTLEEINSLTKRVDEILDAVNTEVSLADELSERFNDYQDKVFDEDGKLDYAATIKAMLKDNTISEDEAEIMRKYKSSIVPPVERVKKTEAELAVEKEQLIKAVQSLDVDAENLPTRDERGLATELSELIKTDAIKELTNNQLKNLFKTIDNINNGYLPHYAQLMVERLNAINNAKQLASGVQKASLLPFSKLYANLKAAILNIGKKRTSGVLEMIRRNPLSAIDQLLGNYKDNTVFKAMFEKSAEAEQKYKSAVSNVLKKLTDAQEKVSKSFNNDGNKTLLSSFKMMTYMVQLEHDSNIGSKQVNQAADYLKATIKHIDEGKSEFGERDATILQSILDDYTNEEGQIDIDKLYKSFNNAEKDAIKTVREINESLTDKAVYTASIIRGDKINPLNNYVHLNVLTDVSPTDNLAGVSSMEQYNQSIMPSSKAKSLIERTGKVSPLNFDVFTSAMRGANYVLMDYNLTEPIRTARKTINEAKALMEKDGRMPKKDRDLLNAISNAYEEVVSNILTNNFIESSIAEEVLNFITKQGYRAILASAPRFIAELSSNVSYALIAEPKAFSVGVGLRNFILSPSSVDVMNNVGSKETTRVYPEGTLSGRLVDTSLINQVSGIKGGKSKSDVANKAKQIYNNSLKKYKNFVELTADALISTPDKMVMRPIWFGSFVNEFENITGKKPDLDKIAANDEAYMNENKEALDKARDVADDKAVRAGATDNAFMGILKGTVKPNQNGWVRGFNTFNSFMTKFMMYEYVTARTGINAAMGNGSISRKQGVALIAGVTSRMLVYGIMTQMLGSLMTSLILGDDDEEDDKTFLQKVGQYFVSTVTGLIFGRDFGNATRSVVNFGLEKVNEKYLDALREGDYDPYQDAIQYSILPNDPKKNNTDLGDIIMKLGGSTGPAMKTANLIIKKATEEPKKEAEAIERSDREIYQRIPLEVLGNAGFIPLYKDVRKVLLADMYKGLRQSKGPTKKDAEKELLQGYDNRTDMKRYDPALYEQTFGKGSPTYEVDKMIKDMEKQQKEMEQQIKDMTYGYTGETKKKK